jgi:hypothetical protein
MACARCYWKLFNDGHLIGYDHQAAIKNSTPRSWAELEMESRRRYRSIISSIVAKRTHEERAQAASEYCGRVDTTVISRLRQFSPERLATFRRRFSAVFSSSSAANVLKAIAAQPGEHVINPDTAWRCVKIYCLIESVDARKALFAIFCTQHKKPHVQGELELESSNSDSIEHITKWTALREQLDTRLSDLSGGNAELKANWINEHVSRFNRQKHELSELIARSVRGDKQCVGDHQFELPWAYLTVTVRSRPLLSRLFGFLKDEANGVRF